MLEPAMLKNYRERKTNSNNFLNLSGGEGGIDSKASFKGGGVKSSLEVSTNPSMYDKSLEDLKTRHNRRLANEYLNSSAEAKEKLRENVLKLPRKELTAIEISDRKADGINRAIDRLSNSGKMAGDKLKMKEDLFRNVKDPKNLTQDVKDYIIKSVDPDMTQKAKENVKKKLEAKSNAEKTEILKKINAKKSKIKNLKTAGKVALGATALAGLGYGGYKYYQYKHNKNKKK
jgi:glutamyl/glutaminyl-tRNA synthetase